MPTAKNDTDKINDTVNVVYRSHTIARFTHNNIEFVLENNGLYDLPKNSETVQNLIKQNRLVLAPKK